MRYSKKTSRIVSAISLLAASLGVAHATLPGKNGVIVYETNNSIMKLAADGTGPAKNLGPGILPAVSPDGLKIAYLVPAAFASVQLYVMNIDGTNSVKVADVPIYADTDSQHMGVAWSPDGKQIAVGGNPLGYTGAHFYICPASGYCGGSSPFSFVSGNLDQNFPERLTWSNLNQLVASVEALHDFPQQPPYSSNILVDTAHQGSSGTAYPFLRWASWMPDSKRLIGRTYGQNSASCVVTANLDGTNQQLVGSACLDAMWNTVSPDGLNLLSMLGDAAPTYLSTGPLTIRLLSTGQNVRTIADSAHSVDWSRAPVVAMAMYTNSGTPTKFSNPIALDSSPVYIGEISETLMPDDYGSNGSGYFREAVGLGLDGTVYFRGQDLVSWDAWKVVPGPGGSTAGFKARHVKIAGANDGSSQLIAIGMDNTVWHAMRYRNGTWSGFNGLDGTMGDAAIAISGSTASSPGEAQVVACAVADGAVFHRVRRADGSWTPFIAPDPSFKSVTSVAIATDGVGNAYVLEASPAGIYRELRYAAGNWDGLYNTSLLGSRSVTSLSLLLDGNAGQAPSNAMVAWVDSRGALRSQWIANPSYGVSWQNASGGTSMMSNANSVSLSYYRGGNNADLFAAQARSDLQ